MSCQGTNYNIQDQSKIIKQRKSVKQVAPNNGLLIWSPNWPLPGSSSLQPQARECLPEPLVGHGRIRQHLGEAHHRLQDVGEVGWGN